MKLVLSLMFIAGLPDAFAQSPGKPRVLVVCEGDIKDAQTGITRSYLARVEQNPSTKALNGRLYRYIGNGHGDESLRPVSDKILMNRELFFDEYTVTHYIDSNATIDTGKPRLHISYRNSKLGQRVPAYVAFIGGQGSQVVLDNGFCDLIAFPLKSNQR